MSTPIDYTCRKFRDHLGRRCRVQFITDEISYGIPTVENPTGQIIALVMNFGAPDHGIEFPVSRPHIRFNDAEAFFDSDHLPYLEPDLCDLAVIQRQLTAASLA